MAGSDSAICVTDPVHDAPPATSIAEEPAFSVVLLEQVSAVLELELSYTPHPAFTVVLPPSEIVLGWTRSSA